MGTGNLQRASIAARAGRIGRLVLATASGTLGIAAPAVFAQWQDPMPQFWLWSDEPTGWTHDDDYTSFVRVDVRSFAEDPEGAADAVYAEIVARHTASPSRLSYDRIAIILQNFGELDWNEDDTLEEDVPSLLLADADAADPPTPPMVFDKTGDGMGHWDVSQRHGRNLRRQPWMTEGGQNLWDWMDGFCVQFAAHDSPTVTPSRFYFDTEVHVTDISERNYAVLLHQVAADGRYGTLPVPGFGSDTLEDLFIAEQDRWSTLPSGPWWPTGTTGVRPTLAESIQTAHAPFLHEHNRRIWLWYSSICQRAVDAVFTENVYSRIHSAWPACKVNNYGDTRFDHAQANIETDWTFVRSAYASNASDRVASRSLQPGYLGVTSAGAMLSPETNGTWFNTQTNTRGGDLDAPPYYLVSDDHFVPDLNLPHVDLLATAGGTDAPMESPDRADVRWIRHWAESILAHPDALADPAAAAALITPWTMMIGAQGFPDESRPTTHTNIAAKFSLYRALGIVEIPLWTDKTEATAYPYEEGMEQTYLVAKQVWSPALHSYAVSDGGLISPDDGDTHRLRRITRDGEGERFVVDLVGTEYGAEFITGLDIDFANMDEVGGDFLSIHVEGQAREENDDPIALELIPRCMLSLYNHDLDQWVSFEPEGDYGVLGVHGWFGIYTPDGSVRRTFRIDDRYEGFVVGDYIDGSGHLFVRLYTNRSDAGYKMAWDLVQASRYGVAVADPMAFTGPGPPPSAQTAVLFGADMNFDGELSGADVTIFFDKYNGDRKSADLNHDGVVDEGDITRFGELYGSY
ncbi:MAG: hypothetical protein JNK25_14500 [Phycisphaerae bacterium]|nr:hypothetical protein [Phycisphaerae bacterium]